MREEFGESRLFLLRTEGPGYLIHHSGNLRGMSAHLVHYGGYRPDEDSGIPEIIARSKIAFGGLPVRLLSEFIDFHDIALLFRGRADVAVAGLRPVRMDSYCDY